MIDTGIYNMEIAQLHFKIPIFILSGSKCDGNCIHQVSLVFPFVKVICVCDTLKSDIVVTMET